MGPRLIIIKELASNILSAIHFTHRKNLAAPKPPNSEEVSNKTSQSKLRYRRLLLFLLVLRLLVLQLPFFVDVVSGHRQEVDLVLDDAENERKRINKKLLIIHISATT